MSWNVEDAKIPWGIIRRTRNISPLTAKFLIYTKVGCPELRFEELLCATKLQDDPELVKYQGEI
jgi:hypothetical protein